MVASRIRQRGRARRGPAMARARTLTEFQAGFPDEASCAAFQFEAQLGITYKTAWLLAQKLRRSMVDPEREPLEGVVEVDQAEIPFRADDSFFDPVKSGKILVAGAVEVVDRGANHAKPRRKGAKYLDTRSGRIRLAAIADNSAASLEAFVRANVRPGTTLLTDG